MVKIRLSRVGAKNKPFYKIIVTDIRNARDGKFIEKIGFFNPIANNLSDKIYINLDRIKYWLNNGAIASKRVLSLIKFLKK